MFDRISRSWDLVKASASVLASDKELMLFPLVSTGVLLIVIASFALPVIGLNLFGAAGVHGHPSVLMYIVGFLFYFTHYLVIFFFNTALVAAAMLRLDGKGGTFGDGIRIATSRLGSIVGYALIAATVGMILKAIQERVGFVGKIIVGLLGVGWSIATYLVAPVLAAKDVGPIEAIKESAMLLKKTWGENLIGQAGIGVAFGFIWLAVAGCAAALVVLAIMSHSIALIVTAIGIGVLALAVTALVHAALAGIYSAALYRYATQGEGTDAFDKGMLQLAFAPK
ncbi:MAG TPA: DUF6159 family protein [Usitatibacter sp.]|nr:DUF6159 family protein [Usitatibacter sp.]